MPTIYRIHPGIGIARLGNSPDAFYIGPETPASLPIACDARGNPRLSSDGMTEQSVKNFKDGEGRIKRQAARFQIWAYDDEHPEGRPLKLGDQIEGGGNAGTLIDIQWRVYLANKKASWYQFEQLDGEHGYPSNHPLRNSAITDPDARQQLIIDPGPRTVDHTSQRTAQFSREASDIYAATFPPALKPNAIDTLGDLLTDDTGRLLVLGGHGNSGSFLFNDFGQPRINDYANNDGWFDDTSDGPVMARLVMFSPLVQRVRYIDVEYPAWVICAYPRYVPEILDIVTMDDVIEDMAIRQFAERTELYGTAGTFNDPPCIPPTDEGALIHWRAGRLRWNPEHKPWFYRDIWRILYRPDEYSYLCDVLGQSNYPHNQSTRGSFDPEKLGLPPMIDRRRLAACEKKCIEDHHSGQLFLDTLAAALLPLETAAPRAMAKAEASGSYLIDEAQAEELREQLASFAREVVGEEVGDDFDDYLRRWQAASGAMSNTTAAEKLEQAVDRIADASGSQGDEFDERFRQLLHDHLRRFVTGRLLGDCRRRCIAENTYDPYGPLRRYLFDLLRAPGEENQFVIGGRPSSRVHDLPRMPLLCGDNPISNTLVSKFLRLTDYQFYLLRQWALGLFYNEKLERWGDPDPWQPYADWVNRTARDLDRAVLTNILGGSFCPGAEVGWVMRNPSIWREPYRIKADPNFYNFGQTPAQASAAGSVSDSDFAFYAGDDLSLKNDFQTGLQPGDLTKYMSVPWQADFNECSTQPIDITYEMWNVIYPESDNDKLMERERRVWETLWWPAHRPLQSWELLSVENGKPNIGWRDWSPGIPQTNAGDLKMVTEWWRLGFIRRNPFLPPGDVKPTTLPLDKKYISVERTKYDKND
ncbi:MAG TPA: LodA/GoxA family CTQ-dependent oxidase [Blastocatellia bacterium]|nr:LodA/GoxA family CTQ-dependent oxidase [Blastocatellia bacterium]